ncbi:MAG: RodZ domain-containing protein [Thermosynechococcaceae cyanobacterium]
MPPIAFNQEQVQKLAEIGAQLRNMRTKKGLSLPDMATKTMIQQRFLSAIEEGQIDQLPEAIYVRGFIRRFAEALGMNGTQLAETFPLNREQPVSSAAKLIATGAATLRPWHLYLLYAGLIIAAVTGLSYVLTQQSKLWPKATDQTPPQSAAKTTSRPSSPKPVAAEQKPKPKATPVEAKLIIKEPSYLEITADGQSVYVGTLKANTTKTVGAKQQINLSVGNAGGVVLGVNGQTGKVMGQKGEVKDVTLTPTSR